MASSSSSLRFPSSLPNPNSQNPRKTLTFTLNFLPPRNLRTSDDKSLAVATGEVRVCAFPASRLGLQGIGISPDCNPENRATPRQLFNWALEPADDEILDQLFEVGYLDAAVWALENPVEKILQNNNVLAA